VTDGDDGLYVYVAVLWLAVFGMVGFPSRSPITLRSKQLGGLTFLLLLVDCIVRRGLR
jgi:hypothetical protein